MNRKAGKPARVRELLSARVAPPAAQGPNFVDVQFNILLGMRKSRSTHVNTSEHVNERGRSEEIGSKAEKKMRQSVSDIIRHSEVTRRKPVVRVHWRVYNCTPRV